MTGQRCYWILLFLLITFMGLRASERTVKVLFVQSYTPQTPFEDQLIMGLTKGLSNSKMQADITTEYLDADYWTADSKRVIMRRICERAHKQGIDVIVTAGDEAFHTLFSCGDSLPRKVPVVFFGIKYPDNELINSLPNVCGFTSNPDFTRILQQAHKIFPERKEVICIGDDSFLSQKGREDFLNEFHQFSKTHPGYRLKVDNAQTETMNTIISSICYSRNSYGRIVIAPKWSPFLSFIGKNSKAPFFACQNLALTNGAFCVYDADPYTSSCLAGEQVGKVFRDGVPQKTRIFDTAIDFIYDYKQLNYFHVDLSKTTPGTIINQSNFEKYKTLFIVLYTFVVGLLVFVVVWLTRANHREARRRMYAQTRLLLQNKSVAQRDEFDNVYHSIRDGVITFDTDFRIHFTNRSLLKMLNLSEEESDRSFEGLRAGSLFKILNEGKEILYKMLNQVIAEGKGVVIPENSFMQEVHSDNYFLVSGEMVPIRAQGKITGAALSFRNVSEEEIQKRFFNLAVEESSIYPWQFDIRTRLFTFPQSFLKRLNRENEQNTLPREKMDEMIHPDDRQYNRALFDVVLAGESTSARLNFRQRNADGEYEWWEYRTSVLKGLTADAPFNILGVCQNIQRYKSTEEELITARDKALQADKLKSAFLANMSHEIRTPLNAIVGFSDLMRDTSDFTPEEVAQFIETINRNCGLLLALINDILDLSRIESGSMDFQFMPHNLPLLLKNIYDSQQLNMPPNVKLILRIPPNEKKYLHTDSVRLQQVVNNLINNAAKFTTQGSITFGYIEEEPRYTVLFVEDTGKGISEEGIRHIFERFFKLDSFTQGVGLGLSICQTIVERLKGNISVTSEVGKGTRFTVRIPDECE